MLMESLQEQYKNLGGTGDISLLIDCELQSLVSLLRICREMHYLLYPFKLSYDFLGPVTDIGKMCITLKDYLKQVKSKKWIDKYIELGGKADIKKFTLTRQAFMARYIEDITWHQYNNFLDTIDLDALMRETDFVKIEEIYKKRLEHNKIERDKERSNWDNLEKV